VFPLANQSGTGDIAWGELMRCVMETAWLPSGARKPYWRGTITSADYELAKQG
jgi:hypothetical protein